MSVADGSDTRADDRARSLRHYACANLARGITRLFRPPRSKVMPSWRARRRVLGGAIAVVAAIAAAMMLLDATVAEAAKGSPRWLLVAFERITEFGKSGWFLWPSGIILVAIAMVASPALSRFGRLILAALAVRVGFVFTAIAFPSLVVTIVKRLIGRARPFVGGHVDPFLYMAPVWRPDYASMPSGHATTAFAAAFAIAILWPRLRIPMLIYALLIAASRVVLDAHYVSDVIAGAVVGAMGALLVRDWFAARRLGFAIGADGNVRRFPAVSLMRIKRVARSLIAP